LQTADINLNVISDWTPIGNSTTANQFTGNYNGDGFVIRNLSITANLNYRGLFGYIGTGGVVKNVRMENVTISGADYAGGVVAFNNNGTIDNCYLSRVTIQSSGQNIGGVAGYNNGTVKQSYVIEANIAGSTNVGGITGNHAANGRVQNCFSADGTITVNNTGTAYGGGITGNNGSGGIVENCYSTVNVTGSLVGGIVGYNDQGTVKYSYNTSEILGWEYVGGIAGYNNGGEVSKTYNTADIYGWDSTGGIAGVNYSGEIINSYNTGSVNGYMSVGGLAGTNTNGGIVHFSYNSGNVDGYHNVGGIAGWYSGSSPSGGVVAKNLSLGSSLHSSLAGTRIYCGSGFFAGNKARSNMQVWINSILKTVFSNTYGNDGVEVLTGTSLWTVFQDFDTDVWLNPGGILEENYPLPTLRNMPSGVQNPVLK